MESNIPMKSELPNKYSSKVSLNYQANVMSPLLWLLVSMRENPPITSAQLNLLELFKQLVQPNTQLKILLNPGQSAEKNNDGEILG